MKNNVLKAIALFGLTAAATVIITRYKKGAMKKLTGQQDTSANTNRHIPHGRHTIVKKRAQEMLHAGN